MIIEEKQNVKVKNTTVIVVVDKLNLIVQIII